MPDHIDRYTAAQETAYAKKVKRIYSQAAKEAREKLKDFTEKSEAKSKQLLADVAAGRITEAQYKSWLRGQVFQGKQWEQKLADLTAIYTNADEKARQILSGTRRDVFTEAANFTAYQIEQDLGGSVAFNLYDDRTVRKLTRENPQMLPEWKIDEPKDYKWNYRRVNNAVTHGIIQGESVYDIGRRLTSELATSNASKMNLFARTAVTGAQNAGRIERLHETQEMGIQVKKKWLAAKDHRVRDTHAYLDGQERDIDKPFEVDGMTIDYPGDPTAPPELVYNCRCALTYVYPKYQRTTPDRTQSFQEWKEERKRQLKEEKEKQRGKQPSKEAEPEKPWHNREEYERAKANRETIYREERRRAEQWYDDECDRVIDERFGGGFTAQRVAVRTDESLTEEQKEQKLEEIEKKRQEYFTVRDELAKERDKRISEAMDRMDKTFDPEYEYGKIDEQTPIRDRVSAVNPHYWDGHEYQVNCQRCSVAFEVQMRGYDAHALAAPEGGLGAEAQIRWMFGKAELDINGRGHSNTVAVRQQMLSWGEGSRAIIVIDREGGIAGHAFNAIVKDGHFTIIDSQIGLMWDDSGNTESVYSGLGDRIYGGALEDEHTVRVALYRTDGKRLKVIPDNWVR